MICIKIENSIHYIGDFSLIDLRRKDQIFNPIQNINDALKVINGIIDSKTISVEPFDRYINIKLYITDEDGNSILNKKNQNRTINLILKPQLINPISSSPQQEQFSHEGSLYDKFQEQNDYNKLIAGNISQINYNNNKLIELMYENARLCFIIVHH